MDNAETGGVDTSSISTSSENTQNTSANSGERVFRQSEVNEIVKKVKHGAVEDYKRMSAERPDYAQAKYAENVPPSVQQQFGQDKPSLSADEVRRLAVEEYSRLRDETLAQAHQKNLEQEAQKIVHEFFTKLSTGKEKYQDFDDVTGSVDLGKFPNTVQMLNSYIDNASDVMYELAKDRSKLALLEQLSNMSPKDAVYQIQRYSQSIKDNESAKTVRMPNEPLSQIKPSLQGADSGAYSLRDLRSKYKA